MNIDITVNILILIVFIIVTKQNMKLNKRIFMLEIAIGQVFKYNDDIIINIKQGIKEDINDDDVVRQIMTTLPRKH